MGPSGGFTIYGDSLLSSIDNKLSMVSCNSTVSHKVPNVWCCTDSQCCNNSMTYSDLKCSNIHTQLQSLHESYAGPHIVVQVLSAPFGQHQALVNITDLVNVASFLLVHLV